jgi:hypothetical protein
MDDAGRTRLISMVPQVRRAPSTEVGLNPL